MAARRAFPVLLLLALGMAGAPAHAQVYKWKDEKGVTHFSDTPPPPTARQAVEIKTYATAPATVPLPAELQAIASARPVTLYTTGSCEACNLGRAQLRKRGIPYQEKTVLTAADMEALKQAGGDDRLPLLLIGRARQVGYDPDMWDEALSVAGYPAHSVLPPNYLHAAPAPAAQKPAQPTAPSPPAARAPADAPRPPAANAPPNFQF